MAGPNPSAPLRSKTKEIAVVAVSALVLVIGAAKTRTSAPSPAASATSEAISMELPPLPPGAAPIPFDELPVRSEGEREDGCDFKERGFGSYGGWKRIEGFDPGFRLLARSNRLADGGDFRLLVHFHGGDVVRKELAPEDFDLALAGVDLGVGSAAYARGMSAEDRFSNLVAAIERSVAEVNGVGRARANPIVLSSWSAGYGAIGKILGGKERARIAGVVLLDSLYASYAPGSRKVERSAVGPFFGEAREAMNGGPLFYFVFSKVMTPDYASTSEVATMLTRELDLPQVTAPPNDPLQTTTLATRANAFIRGYAGGDKAAHCRALRFLPSIVREHVVTIAPR